jgi:haloacetate dehalogenase
MNPQENRMSDTTRRSLLQNTALALGAAAGAAALIDKVHAQPASAPAWPQLFGEGYKNEKVKVSGGGEINCVIGGNGPGLLLMHGAPQSLCTWYRVAPELSKHFTLVMMDHRGYGDSFKPADQPDHSSQSKRPMALDGVEVMEHFGYKKFPVVGHDRGGRVGRRMALDHKDKVQKLLTIDIVPAHWLYSHVTIEFVQAYAHWFNYLQRAPGPENDLMAQYQARAGNGPAPAGRAGGAAIPGGAAGGPGGAKGPGGGKGGPGGGKGGPGGGKGKGGGAPDPKAALLNAEFLRCMLNPGSIHAMCEDYRASASIDLKNDAEDIKKKSKIECPAHILWASDGAMGRLYPVLDIWKEEGKKITGKGLTGGHSLQEGNPTETQAEILNFLKA